MAILFDWYENPDSYDKSPEDKILHPRLRLNGSRSTDELRRDIQARCSLTETDVTAVLDAVSHVMGRELADHASGKGNVFTSTASATFACRSPRPNR